MIELKAFGFFDSISMNDRRHLFKRIIQDEIHINKDQITNYLKNGNRFITIPGVVEDYFLEDGNIICAPNVMTDGIWAWTEDVVYYYSNYNIILPKDMIINMIANKYSCPILTNCKNYKLPEYEKIKNFMVNYMD